MNNIFDILSNDERVIVLSDSESLCIYTWNKSLTLQEWMCMTPSSDLDYDDLWEEVEVRTLSEVPNSFEEAKLAAKDFKNRVGGNYDDDNLGYDFHHHIEDEFGDEC